MSGWGEVGTGVEARDGGGNIGADRVAKGAKGSQIIEPLLTQL